MSKHTRTVLTDDLDGSEGDDVATHTFALDGAGYEIELSAANLDQLRDALQPFIQAGRAVPARRRRPRTK